MSQNKMVLFPIAFSSGPTAPTHKMHKGMEKLLFKPFRQIHAISKKTLHLMVPIAQSVFQANDAVINHPWTVQ